MDSDVTVLKTLGRLFGVIMVVVGGGLGAYFFFSVFAPDLVRQRIAENDLAGLAYDALPVWLPWLFAFLGYLMMKARD